MPPSLQALDRYRDLLGEDWPAFVAACRRPLPSCGWLPHPGPESETLMSEDGFVFRDMGWRPGGVRILSGPSMADSIAYRAGLLHVQEEASLLPISLLAPKPGERVLDLCAAPGNKTAELALAVGPTGLVVANDSNCGRLNVLRTTLDRLGLANVAVTCLDGRKERWPGDWFDAVVVDAPCSCEGTVRKHPSTALRTTPRDRELLVETQVALLRNAVRMVRPGGRVMYATCTFAPEENESVIQRILQLYQNVRVEATERHGLGISPGLTSWGAEALDPSLEGACRLWPHETDSGGFFAVLLRRLGPSAARSEPPHTQPTAPSGRLADDLDFLREFFGIDDVTMSRFRFSDSGGKWICASTIGEGALRELAINAPGVRIARTGGRVPKLTTQGGRLLGMAINKQFVVLDRLETLQFFRRASIVPSTPQIALRYGYVQVRCRNHAVGVGMWDPETGELTSLYPRAWGGLGPPSG